jgi:hypothetical protein
MDQVLRKNSAEYYWNLVTRHTPEVLETYLAYVLIDWQSVGSDET